MVDNSLTSGVFFVFFLLSSMMWPLLMEHSSEISDSSHAGQKTVTRWQQISAATILVWISASERGVKGCYLSPGPSRHVLTAQLKEEWSVK